MKKRSPDYDCKTCFLCVNCLPEWIPAIKANKKNIRFKKGDRIITEGEPMQGMYFVNEGIVKVHKQWGSEKELIIRFAKSGDIFGHRGLGKQLIYPISATALEPVTACYFSNEFFTSSLKVNTDFTYKLLLFYAAELQESEKRMRNLAHMQVKGRVANALLQLEEKFGVQEDGSIQLNISRQDLASYVGTTYETVFRILSDFAKENAIETPAKAIKIINKEFLTQLSREEDKPTENPY